jgi:pyrimidine deaminase RibD-like protein
MLSGESSVYFATYFRRKRNALLKQREINRKTVSRNIINFDEAVKVVGYLNMFQPDCDFISGMAQAHAEAAQKAYELDGQPLTQQIIDTEIMPEVEKILAQSVGGVIAREKGRRELLQTRTRRVDTSTSTKLRSLTRHLMKMVDETREAIRSELTLHMLEMKRRDVNAQKNDTVSGDYEFMKLAITEARRSVPEQNGKPHPKVGAVVVKNGRVLASAHRGEAAAVGNHAEFIALEKKLPDSAVAGATVYTTLEPCTTRNPPKIPCVRRIIDRKIARVVVGMFDPDPRITGRGMLALRNANIAIDVFPPDLMTEVEELNHEFRRLHEQKTQPQLAQQDKSARVIIEKDRQSVIATLKPFAPRLVDIVKSPDDAEVSELALQLSTILTDSGWKPTILTSSLGEPLSGIVVEIDPKNPPNLTAGNVLVSAFSSARLSVEGPNQSLRTPLTGASVRIVVGRNRDSK